MSENVLTLSGQSIDHYISVISNIPRLTKEEEVELFTEYKRTNDNSIAYKIVTSNLRLVVYFARKYNGYGLPLEDLIQEGNIGLMKSVKRFDPEYNNSFPTYASHYILSEIYDYIIKNWKIVKCVTTKAQKKLFFNLKKYLRDGKSFSDKDLDAISSELNVPVYEVKEMEKRLFMHDVTLDHSDDEEEENSYDLLPVSYDSDPLEMLLAEESNHINIDGALSVLTERERDIIYNRYCIDSPIPRHLLGEKYKVSQQAISQNEVRAIKKMKAYLEA